MSAESNLMDPEEEKQYSPSYWSIHYKRSAALESHAAYILELSEKVISRIPHRKNVKYGDSDRCFVDIYNEDLPNDAPIFVFVHGGAWILGESTYYGYLAEPFRELGIVFASVEYDLAPNVTIVTMVEQIKEAMTFLVQYAKNRGSKGIYLSGHSAGAHLTAMLMSSQWVNESLNREYLKGVLLISGIYDMEPFGKMSTLQQIITNEIVEKANPCRFVTEASKHLGSSIKVIVAVAEHDPPKFVEQAKNYNQELKDKGVSSMLLLIPKEDHFTIVEKLYNKENIIIKTTLQFFQSEVWSEDKSNL